MTSSWPPSTAAWATVISLRGSPLLSDFMAGKPKPSRRSASFSHSGRLPFSAASLSFVSACSLGLMSSMTGSKMEPLFAWQRMPSWMASMLFMGSPRPSRASASPKYARGCFGSRRFASSAQARASVWRPMAWSVAALCAMHSARIRSVDRPSGLPSAASNASSAFWCRP